MDNGAKIHRQGQVCTCSLTCLRAQACMVMLTRLIVQFVGIGESDMASVLTRLPTSFEDVDTDWEIDPSELHSSDKLGKAVKQCLCPASARICWHLAVAG